MRLQFIRNVWWLNYLFKYLVRVYVYSIQGLKENEGMISEVESTPKNKVKSLDYKKDGIKLCKKVNILAI